jgi:hypothetical protein
MVADDRAGIQHPITYYAHTPANIQSWFMAANPGATAADYAKYNQQMDQIHQDHTSGDSVLNAVVLGGLAVMTGGAAYAGLTGGAGATATTAAVTAGEVAAPLPSAAGGFGWTGASGMTTGELAGTGASATSTGGMFVGSNGALGSTGSSLGDGVLNGAVRGAGTSLITGGNPIVGAVTGGIGGGVSDVVGTPSITGNGTVDGIISSIGKSGIGTIVSGLFSGSSGSSGNSGNSGTDGLNLGGGSMGTTAASDASNLINAIGLFTGKTVNTNTTNSGGVTTDSGTNSKSTSTTSGTTAVNSGSVNTQKLDISQAGIDQMVNDLMSGNQGLASLTSMQKTAGLYDSSVNGQLTNDLTSRIVGEVAAKTGTTTTKIGGSTSTTGGSTTVTDNSTGPRTVTTGPSSTNTGSITNPQITLGQALAGISGAQLLSSLFGGSGSGSSGGLGGLLSSLVGNGKSTILPVDNSAPGVVDPATFTGGDAPPTFGLTDPNAVTPDPTNVIDTNVTPGGNFIGGQIDLGNSSNYIDPSNYDWLGG